MSCLPIGVIKTMTQYGGRFIKIYNNNKRRTSEGGLVNTTVKGRSKIRAAQENQREGIDRARGR